MVSYKNILTDTKAEGELYFELGKTMIAQGKFRKAVQFLTEVNDNVVESWQVFYLLGEAYRKLSRLKDAFKNYVEAAISVQDENSKQDFLNRAKELIDQPLKDELRMFIKEKLDTPNLADTDRDALHSLAAYFQSERIQVRTDKKEESNKDQINEIINKVQASIQKNDYQNALRQVEEALQKDADNDEALFLKLRILIEGQIDFTGANVLLNDPDYGYRKHFDDISIVNKLNKLIDENNGSGNAYFFAAYVGHLMNMDDATVIGWLDKAESAGLKNENSYSDTGLFLLRGEIAEKNKNNSHAARNFFETGKAYYGQGNFPDAEKYFNKATGLDEGLTEAFIYYADTLFIRSSIKEPPYNDRKIIDKAYDMWHRSKGIVRNEIDAWYYIVIARIHQIKANFAENNGNVDLWQALLYGERGVALNNNDYSLYAYLGIFCRDLTIEVNSLSCFEQALSLSKEENFRDDKLMLQINRGDFDEPRQYLEKIKDADAQLDLSQKKYNSTYKSWDGYIKFHSEKYTDAEEIFGEIIKEETFNLFARQMKMLSHWHHYDFENAKKEAVEILQCKYKYNYLKEEFAFSWANFILGDSAAAISIQEDFIKRNDESGDLGFSLCQFYLYLGEIEKAEKNFADFIHWTYNKRTLKEFIRSLSVLTDVIIKNPGARGDIDEKRQQVLISWNDESINRLEWLTSNPETPLEELNRLLKEYDKGEGSMSTIAIKAGIARTHRLNGQPTEAARIYDELLQYSSLFPEAKIALQKMENEMFDSILNLLRKADYYAAIAMLESVQPSLPANKTKKEIFLSIAYFQTYDNSKSLSYANSFFNRNPNDKSAWKTYWQNITDLLYNNTGTWNYGSFLKKHLKELNVPDQEELKKSMTNEFWNVLMNKSNVGNADLIDLLPRPIILEISNDLVTPEAYTSEWRVVSELAPRLHENISALYGIQIPGIRIRPNNFLTSASYQFLLDEIPIISGKVEKDKLLVRATQAQLDSMKIESTPAVTQLWKDPAAWVDKKYEQTLRAKSVSFTLDPFEYILAHLEQFLIENLSTNIDLQYCSDYLSIYLEESKAEENSEIKNAVSLIESNWEKLRLFNEVIKNLIREGVPLNKKDLIIFNFGKAVNIYQEPADIIRYIRLQMKEVLPGNQANVDKIELPQELENLIKECVVHSGGKTFLSMVPETCQDVLSGIREIEMAPHSSRNQTLVVTNSNLRFFVRKILELEFPQLTVTAQEELLQ